MRPAYVIQGDSIVTEVDLDDITVMPWMGGAERFWIIPVDALATLRSTSGNITETVALTRLGVTRDTRPPVNPRNL
jgi:hypothetical protein